MSFFPDTIELLRAVLAPRPNLDPIDLAPETQDRSAISSPSLSSSLTKAMASQFQHRSSNPVVFFVVNTLLPPFALASSSRMGFITRHEEVVIRIALELPGEPVEIPAKVFGGVELENDGKAGYIVIGFSRG